MFLRLYKSLKKSTVVVGVRVTAISNFYERVAPDGLDWVQVTLDNGEHVYFSGDFNTFMSAVGELTIKGKRKGKGKGKA